MSASESGPETKIRMEYGIVTFLLFRKFSQTDTPTDHTNQPKDDIMIYREVPRLIFDTANKAMIMGLMAYFSAQVPDPKNY